MTLDPLGPAGSTPAALEVAGCPVCAALPGIEAELVGWLAHALSDADTRRRILTAGGLCGRHWWLLAGEERRRRRSLHGTAELLGAVLAKTGQPVAPPGRCPVCADLATSAKHRFCLLLDHLGPDAVAAAPVAWRPCVPHLRALAELELERWLGQWVARQLDRAQPDAADAARRYVRVRQQRYHHEATGTEADDLCAAMAVLFGPPPEPWT